MNIAIIIPARYASTRFPGKPLAMIAGQTMLSRTVAQAKKALELCQATLTMPSLNLQIAVTTEDHRVANHCQDINVPCLITSADCKTGSDRVWEAAQMLVPLPDFILNLQGDAPFTPPEMITALISAFVDNPKAKVLTPVHCLSWDALDHLRENKKTTPFSGTTVTFDQNDHPPSTPGKAFWFSKNIIPAIRGEDKMRTACASSKGPSPIWQHIGLYGYHKDSLQEFVSLPKGQHEKLEGLEQLRFLENGIEITCVPVESPNHLAQSGIDSPEDIIRAEQNLQKL